MKVYFDTEFTGLHKDTTLISLGCVDENGKTFYAEFIDYDDSQCDDWIKENVIANLKYNREKSGSNDGNHNMRISGNKEEIKSSLEAWLSAYDSVELISDVCHYDMVLFIDIFGHAFKLPKNVNAACHDINQDIAKFYGISETEAFDKSREEIITGNGVAIEGDKHNALYDTKVIKAIYDIISSDAINKKEGNT